jgi:hypothetical protein
MVTAQNGSSVNLRSAGMVTINSGFTVQNGAALSIYSGSALPKRRSSEPPGGSVASASSGNRVGLFAFRNGIPEITVFPTTPGSVSIHIYDLQGKLIRSILTENVHAGRFAYPLHDLRARGVVLASVRFDGKEHSLRLISRR